MGARARAGPLGWQVHGEHELLVVLLDVQEAAEPGRNLATGADATGDADGGRAPEHGHRDPAPGPRAGPGDLRGLDGVELFEGPDGAQLLGLDDAVARAHGEMHEQGLQLQELAVDAQLGSGAQVQPGHAAHGLEQHLPRALEHLGDLDELVAGERAQVGVAVAAAGPVVGPGERDVLLLGRPIELTLTLARVVEAELRGELRGEVHVLARGEDIAAAQELAEGAVGLERELNLAVAGEPGDQRARGDPGPVALARGHRVAHASELGEGGQARRLAASLVEPTQRVLAQALVGRRAPTDEDQRERGPQIVGEVGHVGAVEGPGQAELDLLARAGLLADLEQREREVGVGQVPLVVDQLARAGPGREAGRGVDDVAGPDPRAQVQAQRVDPEVDDRVALDLVERGGLVEPAVEDLQRLAVAGVRGLEEQARDRDREITRAAKMRDRFVERGEALAVLAGRQLDEVSAEVLRHRQGPVARHSGRELGGLTQQLLALVDLAVHRDVGAVEREHARRGRALEPPRVPQRPQQAQLCAARLGQREDHGHPRVQPAQLLTQLRGRAVA
ncbi:hypothetical protein ENSA5_06530 [Enhygromyxa salina]|uniref:Uncharacterized protein n=1 Tax=Enhygromyxa salina TaxID=215803 RepID=A0A2S9YHF4_9BACT|nr:hypothetical protein ENSA5_06530 [Enhygromyxa salina]